MTHLRNADICNAILKHYGLRQYSGNMDNLSSLMHYFLMDAAYTMWQGTRDMECKRMAKKRRNEVGATFDKFFREFRTAFSDEEAEFLLDKVDDFEKTIEHDLFLCRIAIMEVFNDYPLSEQSDIASVWCTNYLAYEAQGFHKTCYRTRPSKFFRMGNEAVHPDIQDIICATKDLAVEKWGLDGTMSEKKAKRVADSIRALVNKIANWCLMDYKKEIEMLKQ